MNRLRLVFAVLLLFCVTRSGAQQQYVKLWDGVKGVYSAGKVDLALFPAPDSIRTDVSVIVCPGGSYFWLDRENEGSDVVKWLNSQGINAFVLYYRVAGVPAFLTGFRVFGGGVRFPYALADAQMALNWVRQHAQEYGLSKEKVGMMGFSAGGHLVMSAACFSQTDFTAGTGVECTESLRPSFVAPIYPVVTMHGEYVHKRSRRALLAEDRCADEAMRDSLSLERHIPAECPPVFLVNCEDDPTVDYHNSVILDEALSESGVEHKYLKYSTGGHGFGASDIKGTPECREWKNEFVKWLKETEFL